MSPSQDFAQRVLHWRDEHGRTDLPWQQRRTPYRVWISEIMLQQTQVAVVIPYFERFMARFPNQIALADAPLDEVLAHWSGLGYYARARNLHRAARLIRDQHHGCFPSDLAAVQALPGIGRSTAGAILSLACGQRHPILDGNVKRVLARRFGVEGWPGKSDVLARLWELAERCTPDERVDAYNQGMMDLGATLCTRHRPACQDCPVRQSCIACLQGRQSELPAPKPSKTLPTRATLMLAIRNGDGEILMEQRPPTGIWGGLWSLPEATTDTSPEQWCQAHLGVAPSEVEMLPQRRHTFSHYRLTIHVAAIKIATAPCLVEERADRRWEQVTNARQLGLPTPIGRILAELQNDSH
ncbi:A/G-specific adenine glycosylase [Thiorhodococcus mannitoliphagus]|uniref:Adenine DNA glycosylase n=1 Tax=Thiorhodococcus mannitoliphagus TaxID=329406 RepID=A0A6P1DWW8_9GAMM|nr:A/G-specific adenine glycosylase [Thiorhodococcus mannitoliphagus]NEX21481.1 A/G-specific adenine glycosylase [Thiorhodococcus mannitoliphagus]